MRLGCCYRARMLQRVARSLMYRAFGLLCYDPRSGKVVPTETATVPPEMQVVDPRRFGIFDRATERAVPARDASAFSLDHLSHKMGDRLPADRYTLSVSMLPPGSGLCIDACTSAPLDWVRGAIRRLGYRYLAIDMLPGAGVQQEDLTKLSFADCSVAAIISCDTIEHISAYPDALKQMYRVLEPGGTAVLHFPVYYFDRQVGIPTVPGSDPWDHVRYFSAREMLELFDRTGFAILRAHLNFDYGALLAVLGKPR
jgi:SAM-dependent methyltransferase